MDVYGEMATASQFSVQRQSAVADVCMRKRYHTHRHPHAPNEARFVLSRRPRVAGLVTAVQANAISIMALNVSPSQSLLKTDPPPFPWM